MRSNTPIALHDPVTWYRIKYAGANYTVGLPKQRKVGLDWYEFLCFLCFNCVTTSQHNFMPYHVTESFKGPILNVRIDHVGNSPSTLIHHENEAFRKLSSNWRNLKPPDVRFSANRKHLQNGVFRKQWCRDKSCDLHYRLFLKHESRITSFLVLSCF